MKYLNKIKQIFSTFSITEKVIFLLFLTILIVSSLGILISVNNKFLVSIPERGGTLIEGVIGTPRFINPVIANSNADRDISSLIYSGLTKTLPNGEIAPDLAERFEISENGLIYDFYLREGIVFHDKEIITSEDVIFTVLKIQDPEIRSPRISEWEGVAIENVSDRQIRFVLEQPNTNFLEKTNVGILPKHLWKETPNDAFSLNLYNIEPIGSGPYKINKISRDNINIPKSYTLSINKNYTLKSPSINKIVFKFAKNENELIEMINNNEVNAISNISPVSLGEIEKEGFQIITSTLPRVFGIFINQTESPSLSLDSARQALLLATPKQQIVEGVFSNYAQVAETPIPNFPTEERMEFNLEQAEQVLIDAGWEKNEEGFYTVEIDEEKFLLSTSISTSNIPELVEVAEMIVSSWRKIGVDASVKIFETSDLNQNVIRPRNFETLLFGNVIENYSDLYSFWHSSRRNDPGLNITSYANIKTDEILEEILNTDKESSKAKVEDFISELNNDIPAIFLYSPSFTYLISNEIKGIEIDNISTSDNRFRNVGEWFIKTDRVWEIFKN